MGALKSLAMDTSQPLLATRRGAGDRTSNTKRVIRSPSTDSYTPANHGHILVTVASKVANLQPIQPLKVLGVMRGALLVIAQEVLVRLQLHRLINCHLLAMDVLPNIPHQVLTANQTTVCL